MIQSRSYLRSRAFGPDEADYAVQIGGNLKAYAKNERMRSPNLYCDKATYIEQVGDVPVERCDNLRTKLRSRWPTQSTFQDEVAAWQTLDRTTRGPTYVEREAIQTVKKRGSSEAREVRSRSDRFMDLLNRVSSPVELESHHKKYNRGLVVEAYQSHGYKNQTVERHLQIVPAKERNMLDVMPIEANERHTVAKSVVTEKVKEGGAEADQKLYRQPVHPNYGKHTRVEFPQHHSKKIIL